MLFITLEASPNEGEASRLRTKKDDLLKMQRYGKLFIGERWLRVQVPGYMSLPRGVRTSSIRTINPGFRSADMNVAPLTTGF